MEGSGCGVSKVAYYPSICLQGLIKPRKTLVRMAGPWAET
jgi:hypothetical protein